MLTKKMIVELMRGALTDAFKKWLDENRVAVLQAVSGALQEKGR